MKKAAAPYNVELDEIDNSISALRNAEAREEFKEIDLKNEAKPKRGRKPKQIDYTAIDFEVYPLEANIISKITYILKEADRLLLMSEIAKKASQYETNESVSSLIVKFGRHINKYEDKGLIKSVGIGRGKRYGLPTWFNGNTPKQEYDNNLLPPGVLMLTMRN